MKPYHFESDMKATSGSCSRSGARLLIWPHSGPSLWDLNHMQIENRRIIWYYEDFWDIGVGYIGYKRLRIMELFGALRIVENWLNVHNTLLTIWRWNCCQNWLNEYNAMIIKLYETFVTMRCLIAARLRYECRQIIAILSQQLSFDILWSWWTDSADSFFSCYNVDVAMKGFHKETITDLEIVWHIRASQSRLIGTQTCSLWI